MISSSTIELGAKISVIEPTDDNKARWQDPFAVAFHQVFTSKPHWHEAKIPLGDSASEPKTARGLVAGLLEHGMRFWLAVIEGQENEPSAENILAFALGGLVDEHLNSEFGLQQYGGQVGDALLPFAGVMPQAQCARLDARALSVSALANCEPCASCPRTKSLYSVLFDRRLSAFAECKQVWCRTRSVLEKVQGMLAKQGFHRQGSFDVNWFGQQQDRIVYLRTQD